MPKNKIIGKNKRKGSNKKTGRDYSKEKKYNGSAERRKYRSELNKEARKRGIYGKRHAAGKDLSHKQDGTMVLEKKSANRARNRSKKK